MVRDHHLDIPDRGVCSCQRMKFVAIEEKQNMMFSQIISEEVLIPELFSCVD